MDKTFGRYDSVGVNSCIYYGIKPARRPLRDCIGSFLTQTIGSLPGNSRLKPLILIAGVAKPSQHLLLYQIVNVFVKKVFQHLKPILSIFFSKVCVAKKIQNLFLNLKDAKQVLQKYPNACN